MGTSLHGQDGLVAQMGQTPWEAAQVAAQTILLDICQRCGDELTGGPAASIPHADPAAAEWKQADGYALVRGRGETELRVLVLL